MMHRILRSSWLALSVLIMLMSGVARTAEAAKCYRCLDSGGGYLMCPFGYSNGHVSCIPYATTCSVGTACGYTYNESDITPDGSFRSPVHLLAVDELERRTCRGFVIVRSILTHAAGVSAASSLKSIEL